MPEQPTPFSEAINDINSLKGLEQDSKPECILLCSRQPNPALAKYCELEGITLENCKTLEELENLGRFDAALVVDWLEHNPLLEGTQLLARLRNLHTPHIWVMLKDTPLWSMSDLIGLGFHRQSQQQYDGKKSSSYVYRLESYNHKRSWNSPKHWANPQNWGKYWW